MSDRVDVNRIVNAGRLAPLASVRGFALLLAATMVAPAIAAEPPITAIAFSPDQKVITASQNGIRVLSWPDLKSVRELPTSLPNIHDLAFSADGRLAVAGGTPAESGQVEIFRWPKGEKLRTETLHDDLVYAVDWSSDGGQLVTAGGDRACRIVTPQQEPHTLLGHSKPLLAVAFLAQDRFLVTAGRDRSLRVWNVKTRTSSDLR